MKLAMIALAALILGACSRDSQSPQDPSLDSVISVPTPPPTPPPAAPAPTNGWIWVMAVRKGGDCIPGATFTVVSGQGHVGEVITQRTPCAVWDYGDVGVWFWDLTPGVAMTLRASAVGYSSVERTVYAQSSGYSELFVFR